MLPLGLLVLALGVLEAFLTWWRRWVQSNAVLQVETAMRQGAAGVSSGEGWG